MTVMIEPSIVEEPAGEVRGERVSRYRLDDGAGTTVTLLTYGGIVESLHVPGRDGERANVVLGFGTLAEYAALNGAPSPELPSGVGTYFGALVGRYANRIAGGCFALDGRAYELSRNDGTSSMHGGDIGFDQRVWSATTLQSGDGVGLRLEYDSPDGEMGFPGTLHAVATYLLEPPGRLTLELSATADAPTVCNLSNHSYWNLGGESSGSALDHLLEVRAESFLPVDAELTPTGELRAVAGGPFDFRRATAVSARIREGDEQIVAGRGYDHCFVLDGGGSDEPALAATLYDPRSGRGVRVLTTQPGIQLYSGNFLDGTVRGSSGRLYRQGDGIALEPQHFPDSPNHPEFPSTIVRPGERYEETIVFELFCDR